MILGVANTIRSKTIVWLIHQNVTCPLGKWGIDTYVFVFAHLNGEKSVQQKQYYS